MSCGMVRKVDELGRVVIPKEMRRVLNIKTGSSIEMCINDQNQVVLKKFSEISNIILFAENLADIIYENFNLPCLICDDEKIVVCKGVSKKDFLNKKIKINQDDLDCKKIIGTDFFCDQCAYEHVYCFVVKNEGFDVGYICLLCDQLSEQAISNVKLLSKFMSSILNF